MACNDEYRHVCLKDLDNYIKRDSYFSDFDKDEIALIQQNLGIEAAKASDYNPTIVLGTFDSIYQQVKNNSLKVGYVYVIKDFRSIYLDVDGNVCGTEDNVPSQEYYVYLTPVTENTFNKNVTLVATDKTIKGCEQWTVQYDITPVILTTGVTNKGTITYLKDTNNNSAYYDFKNIKFKIHLADLNKGSKTYTEDTYLYTFDSDGTDASENLCKNNHLEYGATRNVFLGNTQNVTLAADCHDNIFFANCENCVFTYGTYGNYFQNNVVRCKGAVHEKTLDSKTATTCPKWFDVLEDTEIMIYLDPETRTFQVTEV